MDERESDWRKDLGLLAGLAVLGEAYIVLTRGGGIGSSSGGGGGGGLPFPFFRLTWGCGNTSANTRDFPDQASAVSFLQTNIVNPATGFMFLLVQFPAAGASPIQLAAGTAQGTCQGSTANPQLTANPTSVGRPGTIVFSGTGFTPNGNVAITYSISTTGGPQSGTASGSADSSGNISTSLVLSAANFPGSGVMTFKDLTSGKSASATFTVV